MLSLILTISNKEGNTTFFTQRNSSAYFRITQLVCDMAGTRSDRFSGYTCCEPLRTVDLGRLRKDIPNK